MAGVTRTGASGASAGGILFPLDVLYIRCGLEPPAARAIAPQRLPAVAASLLVHENEMTRTLESLNARTRARILREREPLARVLREGGMACQSLPVAFFRLRPGAEMMAVFGMRRPETLYGRRTRLMHGEIRVGDIVEILTRF